MGTLAVASSRNHHTNRSVLDVLSRNDSGVEVHQLPRVPHAQAFMRRAKNSGISPGADACDVAFERHTTKSK